MVKIFESADEGLDILDCRGMEMVEAHRTLGESCSEQVHRILERRLHNQSEEINRVMIRRADNVLRHIKVLSRDKKKAIGLRHALDEYLHCLESWATGAALEDLAKHYRIKSTTLALLLQDDNTGCQTGMIRDQDGSIHFWHTEEDMEDFPGARFDHLRLFRFTSPEGEALTSFIYPDLLPGSSFGWRDNGFIQAADALFLKPSQLDAGMLANITAWLIFRLGKLLPAEMVIRETFPYFDGYAIMIASSSYPEPTGQRIEFAGGHLVKTILEDAAESYLFQVNCFSNAASEIASRYQRDPFPTLGEYQARISRSISVINAIVNYGMISEGIKELLNTTEGGAYAYRNGDVKATFQAKISAESIKIQVAKGA